MHDPDFQHFREDAVAGSEFAWRQMFLSSDANCVGACDRFGFTVVFVDHVVKCGSDRAIIQPLITLGNRFDSQKITIFPWTF